MTERHMGFDLELKHAQIVRALARLDEADRNLVVEHLKPAKLQRAVRQTLDLEERVEALREAHAQ